MWAPFKGVKKYCDEYRERHNKNITLISICGHTPYGNETLVIACPTWDDKASEEEWLNHIKNACSNCVYQLEAGTEHAEERYYRDYKKKIEELNE